MTRLDLVQVGEWREGEGLAFPRSILTTPDRSLVAEVRRRLEDNHENRFVRRDWLVPSEAERVIVGLDRRPNEAHTLHTCPIPRLITPDLWLPMGVGRMLMSTSGLADQRSRFMSSVFKRKSDRAKKSAPYRIKYKDANGDWRTAVGCTDKQATEQLAKKFEADAALQRAGLHDPQQARRIEQGRRRLLDHLDDYHRAILAKNGTGKNHGSKHANSTRTYVKWVATTIKADRLDGLTASAVQEALAGLQASGKSPRTCNAYLRAVKGFSRWLWRDGRLPVDVLAPLTGFNEAVDQRRQRRAFTRDELARLIEATEAGDVVAGMTGLDRAMLYRLAVGTGFRAGELRSLTPESFDLTGNPPRVTVEAAYAKNRKKSPQPIRDDLATAFRPWLSSKAPGRPVFAIPDRTAEMLRHDLSTATIPYKDSAGRVADFHAFRHTFVTMVVAGGASVKIAQELARHSTPMLTIGRYAHASTEDKTAALAALPDYASNSGNAPPLPTETITRAPNAHQDQDGTGRIEAASDAIVTGEPRLTGRRKSLPGNAKDAPRRNLAASGGNAPRRTRTYNKLIKSQPKPISKAIAGNSLRNSTLGRAPNAHQASDAMTTDPDLGLVNRLWRDLPPIVRQGIMAMVEATRAALESKGSDSNPAD
jgi:integrase